MHSMRRRRDQITTEFGIRIRPFLEGLEIRNPTDLSAKAGCNRYVAARMFYETMYPSPTTMEKLLKVGITPAQLIHAMFGQINGVEPPKPSYPLSKTEWEQILLLRDLPSELRDQIFRLLETIHATKPKRSPPQK
ncbi:hypothetical protein LCGC14_2524260 [marine sediment metagenome]|uniref:HTH cro/C1-type domain-containing protein n=1 Tax=marine sediment metagenome TaxID=412755 RepID=A0A0F9D708_9ZZZZ